MNYIYLTRHGEAFTPEQDKERSLNELGRADIVKMGNILQGKGINVDKIFYSHKKRSKQTAEILAKALQSESKLSLLPSLDPEDSINPLSYFIDNYKENGIFVGHLPNIEILVAYLLNLGTEQLSFSFAPGSVACLKHDNGNYTLEWFVSPSEGEGMI